MCRHRNADFRRGTRSPCRYCLRLPPWDVKNQMPVISPSRPASGPTCTFADFLYSSTRRSTKVNAIAQVHPVELWTALSNA